MRRHKWLQILLIDKKLSLIAWENPTGSFIHDFIAEHGTDRKFCRFYGIRFNHIGRFILICALLLGWICSVIFDPVNVLVSAFMLAFLSGSVLLNVFREELPAAGLTNYYWFAFGSLLVTTILLLQTWFLKL